MKSENSGSCAADTLPASYDLWSLELPDSQIKHKFLTLPTGLRFHYISSTVEDRKLHLIVFLHGFPDSCYLWLQSLSPALSIHANVVSLDLPGFGGSDGLPNYGPDEVLSSVQMALVSLRQLYLPERHDQIRTAGECIVVGHDWGGIIGARIAARTSGLINHLVLVNSVFVRQNYILNFPPLT